MYFTLPFLVSVLVLRYCSQGPGSSVVPNAAHRVCPWSTVAAAAVPRALARDLIASRLHLRTTPADWLELAAALPGKGPHRARVGPRGSIAGGFFSAGRHGHLSNPGRPSVAILHRASPRPLDLITKMSIPGKQKRPSNRDPQTRQSSSPSSQSIREWLRGIRSNSRGPSMDREDIPTYTYSTNQVGCQTPDCLI